MSKQEQQRRKHIQHTGLYVSDACKRYEEELDPIGLTNWTDVKWPLTLHGDSVHFYEYANSIGKLGRNPFTRQPIQSLNDWEPIVHNDLSVEDYHALLNALHERGWCNVNCVKRDLAALRKASRRARTKPELAHMTLEDIDWLYEAARRAPRVVERPRGKYHPRHV